MKWTIPLMRGSLDVLRLPGHSPFALSNGIATTPKRLERLQAIGSPWHRATVDSSIERRLSVALNDVVVVAQGLNAEARGAGKQTLAATQSGGPASPARGFPRLARAI